MKSGQRQKWMPGRSAEFPIQGYEVRNRLIDFLESSSAMDDSRSPSRSVFSSSSSSGTVVFVARMVRWALQLASYLPLKQSRLSSHPSKALT